MSSLESVSETRTDLIAYITDQLNNGVYKTVVVRDSVTNEITGEKELRAKAAANRALVSAGLTPAERAEWDYKTAVGVAQALAESKVSWVPSVMFGGGSSSNSAMDAVGLKMLLDITKSLEKTSK